MVDRVTAMTNVGIPVIGHLGMTLNRSSSTAATRFRERAKTGRNRCWRMLVR